MLLVLLNESNGAALHHSHSLLPAHSPLSALTRYLHNGPVLYLAIRGTHSTALCVDKTLTLHTSDLTFSPQVASVDIRRSGSESCVSCADWATPGPRDHRTWPTSFGFFLILRRWTLAAYPHRFHTHCTVTLACYDDIQNLVALLFFLLRFFFREPHLLASPLQKHTQQEQIRALYTAKTRALRRAKNPHNTLRRLSADFWWRETAESVGDAMLLYCYAHGR